MYKDTTMYNRIISAIYARDLSWGIGNNNAIPWGRIFPTDLRFFRAVTTLNDTQILVVGRKTFESLPPVIAENRKIAILSRSSFDVDGDSDNINVYPSIDELMAGTEGNDLIVIGGSEIYSAFESYIDVIYETVIYGGGWDADTYLAKPAEPLYQTHVLKSTHHIPNADGTDYDLLFNIWHNRKNLGTRCGIRMLQLPATVAYYLDDERYYDIIELNGEPHIEPVILMSGWSNDSFTDSKLLADASDNTCIFDKGCLKLVDTKSSAETFAMRALEQSDIHEIHHTKRTLVFAYDDFNKFARWGLYKVCKALKLPMKFVR